MKYICYDCPRKCGAIRTDRHGNGFCHCRALPSVVRAAPHYGEEPCISGIKGSGTVFFTGCSLHCVFCQNYKISRVQEGISLSPDKLADVMLALQDKGVHNINLVTPTHFTRAIALSLEKAKLDIPVVWNSSGYETAETLKSLDGLVQVYMPDMKYSDPVLAEKYSYAPDYPEVAEKAIEEMFRQRGRYVLDENNIMVSGVLIRHLILPGEAENSMNVIDYIADTFNSGDILFSLMSQYTPIPVAECSGNLGRVISDSENSFLLHYMKTRGIEDGFWQDVVSATDEMVPDFDLTGITDIS